jgi:alpha-amylase
MTNLPTYALKRMYVGRSHVGERWTNILCWTWREVVIDEKGFGVFPVGPKSVAVWVDKRAKGRERLDSLVL